MSDQPSAIPSGTRDQGPGTREKRNTGIPEDQIPKNPQSAIPNPQSVAFDPEIIDKIVRLLCNIQDRSSIVAACLNKLDIAPSDVDATIDEAKTKLTRAADYHRDHELGRALTRLNECYQRAVGVQDTKVAISAQREINKLLDLYPAWSAVGGPDDSGAAETDPAATEESRLHREKIESQALTDLVGAIEAYIEPLKLSDEIADTDADLIRLAGEEIKRLRAKRKNKTKRSAVSNQQKTKKKLPTAER